MSATNPARLCFAAAACRSSTVQNSASSATEVRWPESEKDFFFSAIGSFPQPAECQRFHIAFQLLCAARGTQKELRLAQSTHRTSGENGVAVHPAVAIE